MGKDGIQFLALFVGSCWNTTGASIPYLRDVMDPAKEVPLEGRPPAVSFFTLPEYGLVFTDLLWNVKDSLIAAAVSHIAVHASMTRHLYRG